MRSPIANIVMGLVAVALAGAAISAPRRVVGVAPPRAQLGQGNNATADVSEPVRQALISYLKGPAIEVVSLESRIPQQIAAEATEKGCAYVLYTDVTQKAKGGSMAFLKKIAPMASALPMLGAASSLGSMGTQMAVGAMAQGVIQAQVADAQADAIAAIGGAQKNVVKAGDALSVQYKLVRPGGELPLEVNTITGKAKTNGDDVLSPLIETVAIAVVGAVTAAP